MIIIDMMRSEGGKFWQYFEERRDKKTKKSHFLGICPNLGGFVDRNGVYVESKMLFLI